MSRYSIEKKCKLCNDEYHPRLNGFKCSCCQQFIDPDLCLSCHNKNDRLTPSIRYRLADCLKTFSFPLVCGIVYLMILTGGFRI